MDDIKGYVLSILSVSIISAASVNITSKMGGVGKIVKMICGILFLVTLISPFTKLTDPGLSQYISRIKLDAEDVITEGKNLAQAETESIIKKQSEAYILDRAAQMGLAIEVDITLSESTPTVPVSVSVIGDVSPYFKQQLRQIISHDLGVPEDFQIWQ